MGFVTEYIVSAAAKSQLLAHQVCSEFSSSLYFDLIFSDTLEHENECLFRCGRNSKRSYVSVWS